MFIKKGKKGQIPDIHIKKNDLAVECSFDNSVFCFGNIDNDTEIIQIFINENGDIKIPADYSELGILLVAVCLLTLIIPILITYLVKKMKLISY